jgi:hypothetical protein
MLSHCKGHTVWKLRLIGVLEGAEDPLARQTVTMVDARRWVRSNGEAKAKYELTSPALCSEFDSRK